MSKCMRLFSAHHIHSIDDTKITHNNNTHIFLDNQSGKVVVSSKQYELIKI